MTVYSRFANKYTPITGVVPDELAYNLGIVTELIKIWNARPAHYDVAHPHLKELTIGDVLTKWDLYKYNNGTPGYLQWWEEVDKYVKALTIRSIDEVPMTEACKRAGKLVNLAGALGFYFGGQAFNSGRRAPLNPEQSPIIEA